MLAMHQNRFGLLENQHFHPRLLKSRYWGVHHSEKRVDHDDNLPLPTVNRACFDAWFSAQPKPSSIGVPEAGQLGESYDDNDVHQDTNDDGSAPAVGRSGRGERSRQQKLHDQKMGKIQENHFELLELCKGNRTVADEFLDAQEEILKKWRNRKRPQRPGRPSISRLRGVADDRPGTSQPLKKKQKPTEADPVLALRERIRKKGLPSGSYVQIVNRENEKWFMRIVDGHVLDADGDDPSLSSAIWCEPNSVTRLSKTHTRRVPCEIRGIMDAGSKGKFQKMLATTKESRE